ncbi:MAG TPA: POTRA domain-containing protein [Steroidobacteraceae bacterium]
MPIWSPYRRPALASWALGISLLAAATVAQASIRIEIEGVEGSLRRNVVTLLSLERYKDNERVEPEAVERLYRRADDEVRSALRPFGYYEPTVTTAPLTQDRQHNWIVHIAIDPGQPVLITVVSIIVRGDGATDPSFTKLAPPANLKPGHRLEHADYEQAKDDLQRVALTFGYLDARLQRNELLVDPTQHSAEIHLEIDTGARYRFGATTIDQNVIRESQFRRFLRYQEGEFFDVGKQLRTQFALDDSQYFSTVDVERGDPDTEHHTVPMHITAKRSTNSFSFGPGYGTDTGARITAGFTNPVINDRGHRLRILVQASQIEQLADASYDIPIGDPARDRFSIVGLAQYEQLTNSVTASALSLGPSFTEVRGVWQTGIAVNGVHAVTTDELSGRQGDYLVVPQLSFATVPEGYLGEALFTRVLNVSIEGSDAGLGANTNFLRADVQSERVLNISPIWHLLLRGEVGAMVVGNFPELPGFYRFFAGGDRSVRGFEFDSLSPTRYNSLGQPVQIGAPNLITGTFEVERDLPRSFGIATFFDFGNAIDHFNNPLAASVGIGGRWRLPVVTVGLDIAQAVRAPGQASLPGPRLSLNISPKL